MKKNKTSSFLHLREAVLLVIFLFIVIVNVAAQAKDLGFTDEELTFLEEHPVIRVSNEMDWTPFNFNRNDIPQGFSIDYMTLLAETIGFEIDFISGLSWNDFMEMIQNKDLDIILNIAYSDERAEFIKFTEPYFEFAPGLFIRNDYPIINSVEDLYGKKFAVPKGFFFESFFKDHPQVELVRVLDTKEAILAVSNGSADAMLDLMPVVNFFLNQLLVTNLKAGGTLGVDEGNPIAAHFGIRDDWDILRGIIDKGMDVITYDEIMVLRHKWMEAAEAGEPGEILLTSREINWLNKHPKLSIGVDPAWPPFEFIDQNGNYSGIASGLVKAFADRLKVEMNVIPGLTWSEVITKMKAGEIDILPAVVPTEQRREYMNFTEPYISFPVIIAVHNEIPFISNIKNLEKFRVGVIKDDYTEDIFQAQYPGFNLITFETVTDALQKLEDKEIDAFIDNIITINDHINKLSLKNIRISAITNQTMDLSIGVSKTLPELIGIINKALDNISNEELASIKNVWLTAQEVKIRFDIRKVLIWIIPTGIFVALIILFIIFWNRRMAKEIHARKKTEKILEENRQLLTSVIDNSTNLIFMKDLAGKYILANKNLQKVLKFKETEILGKTDYEIHSKNIAEELRINDRKIVESKKAISEEESILVDGELMQFLSIKFPIFNAKGEVTAVCGMSTDITKLKEVENELRTYSDRLSLATEAGGIAVWEWDIVNDKLHWDKSMYEIFGRSADEATSREIWNQGVHPDDFEIIEQVAQETIKGLHQYNIEFRIVRPNGMLRYCQTVAKIQKDEKEKPLRLIGVTWDITERTISEEDLKNKIEELELFTKLTIGRELKMIELKKEINEMLIQSGHTGKYEIVAENDQIIIQ
jgi:PAS domain S-box-containing protein